MKMYLSDQLKNALSSLSIPYDGDIIFTRTKDEKFGHLATNIAMMLAKAQNINPRELAQQIVSNLKLNPELVTKAEIAGGGFINFFYNPNYLYTQLGIIQKNIEQFGAHTFGQSKKVNVEFVSANPTGPLSIGHGRQAVLGDVISRILSNAGYHVTREYYFNNAGVQMKKLGESVRLRYLELLGETIEFPEKHYEGEYIRDIAQAILNEHKDSWKNFDFVPFKSAAEEILFDEIKKVLKRLNIKFDIYFNEDTLYKNGNIEKLVTAFKEKQLTYEKDGALWLKTSTFDYEHGSKAENDKVILKSTGEPTYRLPDMAYHVTKFERGFDFIIDIFGADHIAEYPDVLAGLKALGYETAHVRVLIHQFVTLLKEGEILKMSKRKANYVTIDELLDTLGSDVFRYFLIMRGHNSHLNFDLELAVKETMENPVFYVQNAHARICSIENKAISKGFNLSDSANANLAQLSADEEKDLIQKLLEFPDLTHRLALVLEVHPLTTYLEELSGLYHRYQTAGKKNDALRVITSNHDLTLARLALCQVTKAVIAKGLHILGVSAPTFMTREEEIDTL
ncbi:arginine--tRNA ligase [bacterium]|nr:arginine--tRNA ligase [bacterium]